MDDKVTVIDESSVKTGGLSLIIIEIIALVLLIPLCLAFSGLIQQDFLKILLGIVGSAGLPLWALIISEKLKYNGTAFKHLVILLIISVVSAYPFWLIMSNRMEFRAQNFFSLAFTGFIFCGMAIISEKFNKPLLKWGFHILVTLFTMFIIQSDWAIAIIPGIIVLLYKFKFKKLAYYLISFSLVFLVIGIINLNSNAQEAMHLISLSGSCLALPLLKKYNSDKKNNSKTLNVISYVSYPLILMVIYALKVLVIF